MMLWRIAPKSGSDTEPPAEIGLGIEPVKKGILLRGESEDCAPPHIPGGRGQSSLHAGSFYFGVRQRLEVCHYNDPKLL